MENGKFLEQFLAEIRASTKYRSLDLPDELLKDLLEREIHRQPSPKAAVQAAREKLHNIVAPYLGDPDYRAAAAALAELNENNPQSIHQFCEDMLSRHSSTRERIPYLDHFYERLWGITGKPDSIMDLACGLHPFGLPWMGLEKSALYYAYDIHKPRVDLTNQFLGTLGRPALAFHTDILVSPPEIHADVGLFFKEAHRFEQRRRGSNLPFWKALNVDWLLVSLPAENLTGKRNLVDRQRRLMASILAGQDWPVQEILIGNEMIFCIHKNEP
jgi:16S rRNA (guanine(1405)-N(7))-methyltransferase